MRFHTDPPRLLMLSLSDSMFKLVGKIASLAGLQVLHASRLLEVKFFENQRGIVIVVLEVSECRDTFRMIAEVQEKSPNAPLIIITEPDQNGQDRLALRLGARYVIRKPCHPVELDRLFRFILENYPDEGDCWDSMKQEAARHKITSSFSSPAIKEDLKNTGFLTLAEIKRRAIIATVNLANGDRMRAAKMLGVGKNTVYRAFQENKRKDVKVAAGKEAVKPNGSSMGEQVLSEHSKSEDRRESAVEEKITDPLGPFERRVVLSTDDF